MKTKTFLTMKSAPFCFVALFALSSSLFTPVNAQVGINNTATNPDASAVLDLNTGNPGNKGFLPPQASLVSTTDVTTIPSPATGLIVYNSNSAMTGGNGVGYYYWTGTAWVNLNSTLAGSGTANYVAVWTPTGSMLGTGTIQDNGSVIGVNYAPTAGYEATVYAASGDAVWSETSDANYFAVDANNNNGTAVNANGAVDGLYAITSDANGFYAGVYGEDDNNFGVYGYSANQTGVYGVGGTHGGAFYDAIGDYALVANNNDTSGGYFQDMGGDYTYIAYEGSALISNVPKSTEVKDEKNQERVLFCNESPEVMFEDYGEAQLMNGKAHITIDPLFAKNVAISEKHPLRAYIQLEGDCNGVYVTNKAANGFDVVELNHGTSNTHFQWHIICNRANEQGANKNFADKRFPIGPGKQVAKKALAQPGVQHTPAPTRK